MAFAIRVFVALMGRRWEVAQRRACTARALLLLIHVSALFGLTLLLTVTEDRQLKAQALMLMPKELMMNSTGRMTTTTTS